jgi:hypothetical protein
LTGAPREGVESRQWIKAMVFALARQWFARHRVSAR